jgi:hypothetical protein
VTANLLDRGFHQQSILKAKRYCDKGNDRTGPMFR